jgi:hypothetical protein
MWAAGQELKEKGQFADLAVYPRWSGQQGGNPFPPVSRRKRGNQACFEQLTISICSFFFIFFDVWYFFATSIPSVNLFSTASRSSVEWSLVCPCYATLQALPVLRYVYPQLHVGSRGSCSVTSP